MLTQEKVPGDRVQVTAGSGFASTGSTGIFGTIDGVAGEGEFIHYSVVWDDGEYNGEWWGPHELDEVTP